KSCGSPPFLSCSEGVRTERRRWTAGVRRPLGERLVRHERPIHGLLHGVVVVRISKHFATVDNYREPFPDSVPDAEPCAPRWVGGHDLDPNPKTGTPEKPPRRAS